MQGKRVGDSAIGRTRGLGSRWRRPAGALLGCVLLLALFASRAFAVEDLSGPAYQILAPGEAGGFGSLEGEPGHQTDQAKLYNDLTPLQGNVTAGDLRKYYASEKLKSEPTAKSHGGYRLEFVSRPGVEIWREGKHDIPHIYGATRGDVMYGSGWVAAQDRGLLLEYGLGPAFASALSVPGINAFGLLEEGRSFTPSAEAVKWVEEQKNVLLAAGWEGEQVIEDLEEWAEGVNGYEETRPPGLRLPHVTLADAIAGFSFIGSIFGNGGGEEVANSNFLARLQTKYGEEEGLKIFRDLREVNDPEAQTTAKTAFPYDGVPAGPTPGAMVVEPESAEADVVKADDALRASRRRASNFLLVGAEKGTKGHPLPYHKHPVAVMGPQLGYFYPEIVFQAELSGPGIEAEGIVAPISPYVFIGRGRDFAWSLTSAESENVQQFLLKLCNPEGGGPATRASEGYEYEGACKPMTTFNAGYIGAGDGEPAHEVYFKESVYGPVSGTVMVNGQPYAVATDRSTRGRDPAGELAFSDLDSERVNSPEQFFEAANKLETTFNMAYVDSEHIAYFSAGRLPVLAPGTDPSLPTLGNGEYNWRGFLTLDQHPHEVDPASDFFTNWNNKPAPEWGAASGNYSQGPVQRVELYNPLKEEKNVSEAKDVSVMNKAATQDLRAVRVWPVIRQVLEGEPAPSRLAEEAVDLVDNWVEKDHASLYGEKRPENPGAAVMAAAWTPIAEAVLRPVLGELLAEFESISAPDNPPNPAGSSFGSGWYSYVYKDLRTQLGYPVMQPYSRRYCGNGSLPACRASLWAAIQQAAEGLEASQGPNPSDWRAPEVQIEFPPKPALIDNYKMSWTNRSTFQQVIEFTGHG